MVTVCKFRVYGEPKAFDLIYPIRVSMKEFILRGISAVVVLSLGK